MKKSTASISYNNIIPRKSVESKKDPTDQSKGTRTRNSNEYNFQDILAKKCVIFKSKQTAPKPTETSPDKSPTKLSLRKRSFNCKTDDIKEPEKTDVKKRFKLQAIDKYDNSLEDEDVFEMKPRLDKKQRDTSLSPAKTKKTIKTAANKSVEDINNDMDLFSIDIKPTRQGSKKILLNRNESNDSDDEFSKDNKPKVNKENIQKGTKTSPRKSPASNNLENPYKKVYPAKKIRLNNLNGSKDNDDLFQELDTSKKSNNSTILTSEEDTSTPNTTVINNNNHSKLTPKKVAPIVVSPKNNPTKSPKSSAKSPKSTNNTRKKSEPPEEKKSSSIKITAADLESDDELDFTDHKKIIFKKPTSQAADPKKKLKTEFTKVIDFESLEKNKNKAYDDLKFDLFDGEENLVFNAKSEATTESPISSRKVLTVNDNKSTTKRKAIFSSKRNAENKSCKQSLFNLNPNTEDSNYKVVKESLNDACFFDSNSSASNSPTSNNKLQTKDHKPFKSGSLKDLKKIDEDIELRDSRKAYECEELGENQAFLDDIEYLFDGLNAEYKLSDRCLCAIKFAENCLSSEFRMNLRLSNEYINRIFKSLSDSINYQSLALCTALIMFALTQDKLIMNIEKETFTLILSIINMKVTQQEVEQSNPVSPVKTRKGARRGKTANSKSNGSSSKEKKPTPSMDDSNENNEDMELYNKLFDRCQELTEKFARLGNEKHISDGSSQKFQFTFSSDSLNSSTEDNRRSSSNEKSEKSSKYNDFNAPLLAMECVFNMNINKQHNVCVEWYKNELRVSSVFDEILNTLKSTFKLVKETKDQKKSFFAKKYLRYSNFLEYIVQSSTSALASFTAIENGVRVDKNLKAIMPNEDDVGLEDLASVATKNQNYLVDYQDNLLIILFKDSLKYYYKEIVALKQAKVADAPKQTLILSSIKVNLLLMINLTHNNDHSSQIIAGDGELVGLIFKCISNIVNHLSKEEEFDLLIMSMSILLNIFDSNSKKKDSVFVSLDISSYEIIVKLYKEKENLVSLAEHDQDNEFKQLAEQLESQNEENINTAIMNSIHKAGKHMEDHLIAAYSALLIGHVLQNYNCFIEDVRTMMKDNSFKYMGLIIRKFLVFMKIMNVNGFSADQNVNKIIKFLENI